MIIFIKNIKIIIYEAIRKEHVYKIVNYGEAYDTWAMHLQRTTSPTSSPIYTTKKTKRGHFLVRHSNVDP